ncbi:MAG: ABC transporter ATP-binding protein [Ramlibacter sp.]|nr:ABC transporter ATP-binding protein [Ramlibacter sp.]
MATVSIAGVCKSFGATRVLKSVSLDIEEGEFLTLVGASGCGKTTLLRIIAGLDFADAGSVAIAGEQVDDLAPKARDVAMVFQSYALYPYMTVSQNIALPLTMRWLTWGQRLPLFGSWWPHTRAVRQRIAGEVEAVAAALGLKPLLLRKPANLSGGQRQRVALGRALVRRPRVFLMDEPLSNLDAKLRTQTRAEIAELHRRLGATFIYVTHDQVEAMTMSDRVALMVDGGILQVATPQQIYDDPSDLRVAEFLGTPKINVLPAFGGENGLRVLAFHWPIFTEHDGEAQVAVRPEWWSLAPGLAPVDDASCRVVGRVRHLELLGAETLVHVEADGATAHLVAKVVPSLAAGLHVGTTVTLCAPAERVLVFAMNGKRLARVLPEMPRELQHG